MTDRVLWLDPTFGASGDMLLGVLIGLGADAATLTQDLRSALAKADLAPWDLTVGKVQRGSLNAIRAEVTTSDRDHHRSWSTIDAALAAALEAAALPTAVANRARATFRRLGEVEAAIHGVELDEVHFHEVGAVDAIVDVLGACLGLAQLKVSTVVCGPVGLGRGTIQAAHGTLPLPAPATASLLQGATVTSLDTAGETVTPTGAALLTNFADRWGPIPSGTLAAVARGAGGRDPKTHPNVLTGYIILC